MRGRGALRTAEVAESRALLRCRQMWQWLINLRQGKSAPSDPDPVESSERWERWVKVSIGLGRFEEQMLWGAQQIGRVDVRLIQADEKWTQPFFTAGALSPEETSYVGEHITASQHWVLGAYEFIRTLCDRLNDDDMEKTPADVRLRAEEVKHKFARVRIPLAKMEAASRFSKEDWPTAEAGMLRGKGVSWKVNETTTISRIELSDALLEVLELRRAAFLRWRAQLPD